MVHRSIVAESVREEVERQGYNVAEAARILGVGRTMMHKMIKQGHVRRTKFGARTIIAKSELDRLLNGGNDTRGT